VTGFRTSDVCFSKKKLKVVKKNRRTICIIEYRYVSLCILSPTERARSRRLFFLPCGRMAFESPWLSLIRQPRSRLCCAGCCILCRVAVAKSYVVVAVAATFDRRWWQKIGLAENYLKFVLKNFTQNTDQLFFGACTLCTVFCQKKNSKNDKKVLYIFSFLMIQMFPGQISSRWTRFRDQSACSSRFDTRLLLSRQ